MLFFITLYCYVRHTLVGSIGKEESVEAGIKQTFRVSCLQGSHQISVSMLAPL